MINEEDIQQTENEPRTPTTVPLSDITSSYNTPPRLTTTPTIGTPPRLTSYSSTSTPPKSTSSTFAHYSPPPPPDRKSKSKKIKSKLFSYTPVKKYFLENPDETIYPEEDSGLGSSYIKITNNGQTKIFQITSEKLGDGSFGTVMLGVNIDNPEEKIAIKIMKSSIKNQHQQEHEAKMLQHVGKLIFAGKKDNNFYIATPHIANSITLKKYLKLHPNLSKKDKLEIILKILKQLKILHNVYHTAHGDFSFNNILINQNDGTIEVIDLGSSNILEETGIAKYRGEAHSFCPNGDDAYLPPEFDPKLIAKMEKDGILTIDPELLSGFITPASDIYTLGWCINKYMNNCSPQFSKDLDSPTSDYAISDSMDSDSIDLDLTDLAEQMCVMDPFSRLSIPKIIEKCEQLLKTLETTPESSSPVQQSLEEFSTPITPRFNYISTKSSFFDESITSRDIARSLVSTP